MKLRLAIIAVFLSCVLILVSFFNPSGSKASFIVTTQWAKISASAPSNVTFLKVVTDSLGNSFVVGYGTNTGTYDFGNGVTVETTQGLFQNTGFLIKYDASGVAQWVVYATTAPGISDFTSVALGPGGDVYVAGDIYGTGNYDFGNGVVVHGAKAFDYNVLLIKVNSSGAAQWGVSSTTAPSANYFDYLTVDSSDNVYVNGTVNGTSNYNIGGKTVKGVFTDYNFFIMKFNSAGTAQWGSSLTSGPDVSAPFGIGNDSSGNTYSVGYVVGDGTYNFGNSVTVTPAGPSLNILIVKYDTGGLAQWADTATGASDFNTFNGVAVSSDGTSYAVGQSVGTGTVSFGSGVTATGGGSSINGIIVKYNSSGVPQWANATAAAPDNAFYNAVAVDTSGNSIVAGQLYSTGTYNFGNSVTVTPSSPYSPLVVQYDSAGTAQWVKTADSVPNGAPYNGISLDASNNIYTVGYAGGVATLDLGDGVTVDINDSIDTLLAKYTVTETSPPTPTPTPTETPAATPVPVTPPGPPPACGATAPGTAPLLFNAVRSGQKVTLWFTPVNENSTGYAVLYGLTQGHDIFGTSFNHGFSPGALSYDINGLIPSQVYYFRIRAVNDCAPGPLSNYIKAIPFASTGATPSPTPNTTPTASPVPTCEPKPACVDATPACLIPVPPGGWCTVSPTPTETPAVTPAGETTPPPSGGGTGSIISVIDAHGGDFATVTDAGAQTGGGFVVLAVIGQLSGIVFRVAQSLPGIYELTERPLYNLPFDYVGGIGSGIWSSIVGFFGPLFGIIRKKRDVGRVFDGVSGKPVSGAHIILFSASGSLKTSFTDKFGQYELKPRPDTYQLRVNKDLYKFPSSLVTVTESIVYSRIYVPGEKFVIKEKGQIINHLGIPIDPVTFKSSFISALVKAWQISSSMLSQVSPVFEALLVIAAGLAAYTNPGLNYKAIFILITAFSIFDITGRIITSRSFSK